MWEAIGGGAIVSGIVLLIIGYFFSRYSRKEDDRAKAQQRENIIIMKNLQGIGHLAEATAEGHKTQHFDGNIDEALEYYHKARDDMNTYLLQQNAIANH